MPVALFQKDLYAAVKADAKLARIPVFHSSEAGGSQPDNCGLQFLTIPNGAGKLMTTEECMLSEVQARNPGRTRRDLERIWAAHLGVREAPRIRSGGRWHRPPAARSLPPFSA